MAEPIINALIEIQEKHNGQSYPHITDLQPSADSIYELNLNTRQSKLPQFLSVQYDHNAEIVYFKCSRYYEHVDLSTMACVIQYINANKDAGLFWVPYYDTEYEDNCIIIPWVVDGLATAAQGTITFNLRFYQLIKNEDNEYQFAYNLSTIPQQVKIVKGMDLPEELEKYSRLASDTVDELQYYINNSIEASTTYWIDL